MKVRKFKLRAPPNPVAVALKARRGGGHRKSNKALRRAANTKVKRDLD